MIKVLNYRRKHNLATDNPDGGGLGFSRNTGYERSSLSSSVWCKVPPCTDNSFHRLYSTLTSDICIRITALCYYELFAARRGNLATLEQVLYEYRCRIDAWED